MFSANMCFNFSVTLIDIFIAFVADTGLKPVSFIVELFLNSFNAKTAFCCFNY